LNMFIVADSSVVSAIGWEFCASLGVYIIFNFGIISLIVSRSLYLIGLKYYKKAHFKLKPSSKEVSNIEEQLEEVHKIINSIEPI